MNEEILLATTTLNNLKQHDYEVSDYKMCLKEGEICQRALRHYIRGLTPVSEGNNAE